MRLALAFSAARWLPGAAQRRMFRDALAALPAEVLLYWFTLCFYGYRQAAGRAALRVLLTHHNMVENAHAAIKMLEPTKKDVFMALLPMFHTFSWTGNVIAPMIGYEVLTSLGRRYHRVYRRD